jgi:hypothetical protein
VSLRCLTKCYSLGGGKCFYSAMAALRNLKRINLRISCVVQNLCPLRYRSNTIAVLPYRDERSELALSFWKFWSFHKALY